MRRWMTGWAALSVAFWAVVVPGAGVALSAGVAASADGSSARADFNRDGFADLAVGVPGEDSFRGGVNVIYGSARGLTARDQYWTQDSRGIRGRAQDGDTFGAALAASDFDGDGFADLAVGVPGESNGQGAVNVIYGSAHGLTAAGNQYWSQDSPGIKGKAQAGGSSTGGDTFGWTLVATNFGKSTVADLAVGVPGENTRRGAVNVIYGSARGLTAAGNQYWTQDSPGIIGQAQVNGRFGYALTAANFGKSRQSDLAVGAPGRNTGRGAVNVIYGSAHGLTAAGDQYWTQDTPGIKGKASPFVTHGPEETFYGDQFGSALAAANLGKSAQADLAVGVPNDGGWPAEGGGPGAVNVIYGSAHGLTAAGDQLWTLDSPGIRGQSNGDDVAFGSALTAANFGKSGQADLAVGALKGNYSRGAVSVIYGSAHGLTAAGNQYWTQESPGIKGQGDQEFGSALTAANFGKSGQADLAVGVPSEGAGAVNVIYGSAHGLTAAGDQYWTQDSPGIKGKAEDVDLFGSSLLDGGPSILLSFLF